MANFSKLKRAKNLICNYLCPLILKKKYARHAFSKSLSWNWKDIHFNRCALVNLIVTKKKDPAYLEIGCDSNLLFDSVVANNKIGVDPMSGGTIKKTSDEFFANNQEQFDVIFIDGLHTYEQVHRDCVNAMKFLKPGGWVALHDLLPSNWIEHHVPKITVGAWTGDVWKVAFELIKTEGIDFKIIKIDYGVGVFRLLKDKPELIDLSNQLKDKEFVYFYENHHTLPLIDWETAQDWINQA